MTRRIKRTVTFCSAACLFLLYLCGVLCLGASPEQEALDALDNFSVPKGLQIDLFADGRYLANPVAFCFDDVGRVYVAETFRMYHGVEENRRGEDWLNDDLACQSVEDRLSMLKKWADEFEDGWSYFSNTSEQIRLVEDTDGDGRADRSTVFSDDYDDPLDGLAAGLVAGGDSIYFACAPNVYQLRDANGDGRAEQRKVLHHGFGVRHAFIGHDLHGLIWGPDGKLYFSMGDRGFHVETKEGRTLHSPNRGGVLRCDPDGANLELFATGLRNPQEIAFDQFGNLFTCDNNSDAGDQARVVYLPEGSDSGWQMEFQYLEDENLRGPWTQEKLWHPQHPNQPAWMLPPLAWIGAGPSGLTYYPGIGLPDRYDNHFFMCDFRANQQSCIRAFAVEPKGAGFEVIDEHEFWQHIVATDVEFGYDGGLYALDFIEGWDGTGQGRIYRLVDPVQVSSPAIKALPKLFSNGFASLGTGELIELLHHADMRVRQRAQFTLAGRGDEAVSALVELVNESHETVPRLHAIWGLGQIAREKKFVLDEVAKLLADPNPHVRTQAAKVLGDSRYSEATARLLEKLGDEDLHVRSEACLALGKIGSPKAVDSILAVLEENQDTDVFLRHAGVMGLAGIGDATELVKRANHPSAAVRMGILLALRRLADPHVAAFLDDAESRLVVEAARAIHDVPIDDALPVLARMVDGYTRATTSRGSLVIRTNSTMQFTREFWHDIPGVHVADLTTHPKFESSRPDETDATSVFSNGAPRGANYGTRIHGIIEPPETGHYVFYLTSDDEGQLFLSDDENPERKRLVASVATYAVRDNWEMFDTQTSEPIHLEAGGRYYIEALHKEGGSPDHLDVGWKLPDGSIQRPIGGDSVASGDESPTDPTITALLRRVINANFRLGEREHVMAIAAFVSDSGNPLPMRRLAAAALNDWTQPPTRDAVLGHRQYLAERDFNMVREVLQDAMAGMLQNASGELVSQIAKLAETYRITADPEAFVRWALDVQRPFSVRREAIRLLARQSHPRLLEITESWLADLDPLIRSEARWIMASSDPDRAVVELAEALAAGVMSEKQQALATLAALDHPQARRLLAVWSAQLVDGTVPEALQLDVLEAARQAGTPPLEELARQYENVLMDADPLGQYKLALKGGNLERGAHSFFTNNKLRCQRCHKVGDRGGGEVGPDLTGIGALKDRVYILQSIIAPNEKFAEGFAYTTLFMDDGRTITGRVVRETEGLLVIQSPGKEEIVIPRDTIEDQVPAQSAMPANLVEQMTKRELRDLVEFLARQTNER